jgi:cytochrome P450
MKNIIMMTIISIYAFIGRFYKLKFTKDDAEKFFIDLMKQAMEYREVNKVQRADYLDHLLNLKAKKEISDLAIAAQGASFLIDGFDTSSSAISATLYELAKNREIQKKLRKTIFEEMPTDEDFNYDNINNCGYLDQVWNEALRMHSPVTYLSRFCNEPITLEMSKGKKLSFDYGDIVLIPILSIHKNPQIFNDPEKFDPDRFSPEIGGAKSYIDQGKLFTFGIGPRACVGSRFAIVQSKLAIASIIRNFEITLNPKTPEKFVLNPQKFMNTLEGNFLNFQSLKC